MARDLEGIFDFLFEAATGFGNPPDRAFETASARLVEIEDDLQRLGRVPHQGTLRPHLGEGIRNVTKSRTVIYFEVDDSLERVRVLAVFHGGQDHDARILLKLLTGPDHGKGKQSSS